MGNMGTSQAAALRDSKVPGMKLMAVCDAHGREFSLSPRRKPTTTAALSSVRAEWTRRSSRRPHYSHTPIGIEALKAGLHVLVEKPWSWPMG